ncbi:MAG: class I SAM-dependent methyltransferase [Treponemataceae bacterium]
MTCIFCENITHELRLDTTLFHRCDFCKGVFKDSSQFLLPQEQKNRYEKHNNCLKNISYKEYLKNYTKKIERFLKKDSSVIRSFLDFGCGPLDVSQKPFIPILEKLLKTEKDFSFFSNMQFSCYDIHFANHTEVLEKKFDLINCLEVVEHFENPRAEFALLLSLCNKNATLIIATQLVDECTNFASWWYKEDVTHVAFYSQRALEILAKKTGFRCCEQVDKNIFALRT